MRLPDNLRDYYDEDYWNGHKVYHDLSGVPQHYHGPGMIWHGFEAIRDALFFALGDRPRSLLDCCCGGGDFVRRCLQIGIDAYGFDGSQHAITHAGRDLDGRLLCEDALKIELSERYECVTAFDTLEHFYTRDLPEVISRFVAHAEHYVVFCIGAADSSNSTQAYSHEPGKMVPPQFEGMLVSGHVTIQPFGWWVRMVMENVPSRWHIAWPAMTSFQVALIEDTRAHGPDGRPLQAWGPNRVLILESK